ncbi:hypothetical protein PR048_031350 [Dryococelus australis]|uniref:Uncharacterized protein n=1 Tax=Dryococelus australis TaxID=614101 RepID=A0ABQ9G507_9NEOP|nr:hypothetical protein PR048_031350 [Dryococelus australis]
MFFFGDHQRCATYFCTGTKEGETNIIPLIIECVCPQNEIFGRCSEQAQSQFTLQRQVPNASTIPNAARIKYDVPRLWLPIILETYTRNSSKKYVGKVQAYLQKYWRLRENAKIKRDNVSAKSALKPKKVFLGEKTGIPTTELKAQQLDLPTDEFAVLLEELLQNFKKDNEALHGIETRDLQ